MKTQIHQPQVHQGPRREFAFAWTLLFLLGIVIAALLTLGGVHWLMEQRAAAADSKSEVIATILGAGFVFVGPVLLFALAVLSPQWWLRGVKSRAKRMLLGTAPH